MFRAILAFSLLWRAMYTIDLCSINVLLLMRNQRCINGDTDEKIQKSIY